MTTVGGFALLLLLTPLPTVMPGASGSETWGGEGGEPRYAVFAAPAEYPYENGDPDDPGDDVPASDPEGGRSVVVGPADPLASPFGWHDDDGVTGAEYTIPRGNNVHAYLDHDADNLPDPDPPDGGGLLDFSGALVPLDLIADDPLDYDAASVVHLFYWANRLHDVLYRHGFDEAAGNFQHDNYDHGGLGNDAVQAEAQDGSGTNGGNFATPPDGASPRMQMFIWTLTDPRRDGAFSNMVVSHEYGHGLASRLTGGPSNASCLSNAEQMVEGWGDFLGLIFTAHPGDQGDTRRGVGTYLLGEPPEGDGFRPAPYTTDSMVNGFTYADTPTQAVPHGIGFVWATILWDMSRALIDVHGFNPDLADDWSSGGNNLALQLVIDGLALQPCSPGFVDGRDAILLADQVLTGGANQCLLWGVLARRGLGASADQGSSFSNADNVAAFDLPEECIAPLFADGFEAGDTSAWGSTVP